MPYKNGDDPNYLHVNVHPPSSLSPKRRSDLNRFLFLALKKGGKKNRGIGL